MTAKKTGPILLVEPNLSKVEASEKMKRVMSILDQLEQLKFFGSVQINYAAGDIKSADVKQHSVL